MNPIKSVIDRGLSDLTLTPNERDRLVNRLTASHEEACTTPSKSKKIRWGILLASALLLVGVAALAVSLSGYVDWTGGFQAMPADTPTIAPASTTAANFDAMDALMSSVPDGEYWTANLPDGSGIGRYGFIGPHLTTMDELAARLKHLPLQLPAIPEGYALSTVELTYDRDRLVGTLYDQERHGELTLNKYRLAEAAADDIQGYSVTMTDADGKRLVVDGNVVMRDMYEEPAEGAFFVSEDESYDILNVAGFDRAIAITRDNGVQTIYLQQELAQARLANYNVWSQKEITIGELFRP